LVDRAGVAVAHAALLVPMPWVLAAGRHPSLYALRVSSAFSQSHALLRVVASRAQSARSNILYIQ